MGRRVVITLVSVLSSVLLGVLGGVVLVSTSGSSPTDPTEPDDVPVAARPSDTVQRYLEALADADASAALAEAAVAPADRTLLTDEVLQAAQDLAPLSEISVPETESGYSVEASYRVGAEVVTSSFSVSEVPGGFKLDEVTSSLDVSDLRTEALPLVVAGSEVNGDSVTVFPGLYPVQTESPYLSYGPEQVLVKYPGDSPSTSALGLVITDQGRDAFAELVNEQLQDCLASSDPEPEGCPFAASISSSHEVSEDSGSWSSEAEDLLAEFDPDLDYDTPTTATWFLNATLEYSYSYTSELEDGTQDGTAPAYIGATYAIDLLAEPLEITWS